MSGRLAALPDRATPLPASAVRGSVARIADFEAAAVAPLPRSEWGTATTSSARSSTT